jgi:hypothetical protein
MKYKSFSSFSKEMIPLDKRSLLFFYNKYLSFSSKKDSGELEIEFRFSEYSRLPSSQTNEENISPLSERTFFRLKSFFSSIVSPKNSISFVTEDTTYEGGYRMSKDLSGLFRPPISILKTSYLGNSSLGYLQVPEYGIKIATSLEKNVSSIPKEVKRKFTRRKERFSFWLSEYFRLDLTSVQSTGKTNQMINLYEMELEIVPFGKSRRKMVSLNYFKEEILSRLNSLLRSLLQQIYLTVEIYSKSEYFEIVRMFNLSCGSESSSQMFFDENVMYQARPLKPEDLVSGGIVNSKNETYSVTHKIDGLRRFLVFSRLGIWFVYPPSEANLLSRRQKGTIGTVIEGEYLSETNTFYAFDTLASYDEQYSSSSFPIGSSSIATKEHSERLGIATIAMRNLEAEQMNEKTRISIVSPLTFRDKTTSPISWKAKEFYPFSSPDEFYLRMVTMLEDAKNGDFANIPTDGLIFMPMKMPYNSKNDRQPLSSRILSRMSDICKWKPIS